MFDLKDIRVCQARDIVLGEVASLSIFGGKPAIVSQFGDEIVAVQLDQDLGVPDWVYVDHLSGTAVVHKDVVFEVDPSSITESNGGKGTLVRSGKDLLIVTPGAREMLTYMIVATGFEDTKGFKYFFSSWRAVLRKGDEVIVLFEKKAH